MAKKLMQIRQGDVLLVRRSKPTTEKCISEKRATDGSVVLAHGEVTGHRHRFAKRENVELMTPIKNGANTRILEMRDRLHKLLHEEHSKIDVALEENEKAVQWDMPMQTQFFQSQLVQVAD